MRKKTPPWKLPWKLPQNSNRYSPSEFRFQLNHKDYITLLIPFTQREYYVYRPTHIQSSVGGLTLEFLLHLYSHWKNILYLTLITYALVVHCVVPHANDLQTHGGASCKKLWALLVLSTLLQREAEGTYEQ